MCGMHYMRYKRNGDPNICLKKRSENVLGYLEDVILAYDGEECIEWPFAKSHGYGRVNKDGKFQLVSRIVCEVENGKPPSDKHFAAHSCGNGHLSCCNRKHISWKTPAENAADRFIHGTQIFGEKSNLSKLSEDQVKMIISLKGLESQRETAKRFGIDQTNVSLIQRGSSWKHIQRLE